MQRAVLYLDWLVGAERTSLRKEAGTISVPEAGKDYVDSGLQQYSPRKVMKVAPNADDGVYITLETIDASGLSGEQVSAWNEHATRTGWQILPGGTEARWMDEGQPNSA